MRRPLAFFAATSLSLAAFAGCASTEDLGLFEEGEDDEAGTDAAPKVDSGRLTGGGDSGTSTPDSGRPTDAGPSDGAAGDGGPGGDAGPGACASPNRCQTAEELDEMSGDTGGGQVTLAGTTSKWFKIPITDEVDAPGGDIKARFELQSPAGTNFDLFVYVADDASNQNCSAPTTKSEKPAGQLDTASVKWGDTPIVNNDRLVTVEVRHVSGACAQGTRWQLQILGNVD